MGSAHPTCFYNKSVQILSNFRHQYLLFAIFRHLMQDKYHIIQTHLAGQCIPNRYILNIIPAEYSQPDYSIFQTDRAVAVNITWQDRRFTQNADGKRAVRALAFRISTIRHLNNHIAEKKRRIPWHSVTTAHFRCNAGRFILFAIIPRLRLVVLLKPFIPQIFSLNKRLVKQLVPVRKIGQTVISSVARNLISLIILTFKISLSRGASACAARWSK